MNTSSALGIEDIRFHPLSANEWRVSDSRHPQHSVDALLGFVAQKGSTYYATRMYHPLEASPLRSLEEVARFFVETPEADPKRTRDLTAGSVRRADPDALTLVR